MKGYNQVLPFTNLTNATNLLFFLFADTSESSYKFANPKHQRCSAYHNRPIDKLERFDAKETSSHRDYQNLTQNNNERREQESGTQRSVAKALALNMFQN